MIANIQKIRMFKLMTAATGMTWGRVANMDYAFFLFPTESRQRTGCFNHLYNLDKATKDKTVVVGHGELIFYNKVYGSADLTELSNDLKAKGKVGSQVPRGNGAASGDRKVAKK